VIYGLRCRVGSFCGALIADHAYNGGPAPDDDDDDNSDFVVQYLSKFLQTRTLLGNAVRSVLMAAARRRACTVDAGDDAAAPRPGRGVAASGAKAEYTRVGGSGKYQAVRNSHDPLLFEAYVRMGTQDFDYILEMAREELEKPLNHDLRFTRAENVGASRENAPSTPPASSSST
jgi:hypothetical protein